MDNLKFDFTLKKEDYENIYKQKSMVFWFSGLSGSGKSTLSNYINNLLIKDGFKCIILDGDHTRAGICKDLEFSKQDRAENLRRVAEIVKILNQNGLIVLAYI